MVVKGAMDTNSEKLKNNVRFGKLRGKVSRIKLTISHVHPIYSRLYNLSIKKNKQKQKQKQKQTKNKQTKKKRSDLFQFSLTTNQESDTLNKFRDHISDHKIIYPVATSSAIDIQA